MTVRRLLLRRRGSPLPPISDPAERADALAKARRDQHRVDAIERYIAIIERRGRA